MDDISFTLPQIFSLIGVTQCVYLIVHIVFRYQKATQILPVVYFFVMGLAFFSDATLDTFSFWGGHIFYIQWGSWFLIPPLSALLIMQIAQPNKIPALRNFSILLLLPLALILSNAMINPDLKCSLSNPCDQLREFLTLMSLMAGTISLLVIFGVKDLFNKIQKQKNGSERYWLALTLIFLNALFLATFFGFVLKFISSQTDLILIRTVLGLGFVYLVSTSLLRIFPPETKPQTSEEQETLSHGEMRVAAKIDDLLKLDKVYHEPNYSRSDLAKECGVSELIVSKVINIHFNRSFPQIMNEHRIDDAKRLLAMSDAAIKIVAEEVGFNSLPSFNRVFKDMTGISPSQYRQQYQKNTDKNAAE